jgi:hypothetical protein
MSTYDIKGAFLNAPFQDGDPVIYIRLKSSIVHVWKLVDDSISEYVNDGSVLMKLTKYLYGLKQSPIKFQQHLTTTLLSIGYQQLNNDSCIFLKRNKMVFSLLSTHVDDILNISNDTGLTIELENHLKLVYKDIHIQNHACSYLGINIIRDNTVIYLSQPKLISDLLSIDSSNLTNNIPSVNRIYDNDKNNIMIDKSQYLSIVMKLMFLGRLTRPDILLLPIYHLVAIILLKMITIKLLE